MSVIDSMIKRRNFLLGAVGSTCALTCKKLAAFAGVPNAEMQAAGAGQGGSGAGDGGRKGGGCRSVRSGEPVSSSLVAVKDKKQGSEEQDPAHRIADLSDAGAGKLSDRDVPQPHVEHRQECRHRNASARITAPIPKIYTKRIVKHESRYFTATIRWEDIPPVSQLRERNDR